LQKINNADFPKISLLFGEYVVIKQLLGYNRILVTDYNIGSIH